MPLPWKTLPVARRGSESSAGAGSDEIPIPDGSCAGARPSHLTSALVRLPPEESCHEMDFVLRCRLCWPAPRPRRAGDCCAHCGCHSNCCKVCRLVCETKKVTKPEYDCECEDFCVPGPSKCYDRAATSAARRERSTRPRCGKMRTRARSWSRRRSHEGSQDLQVGGRRPLRQRARTPQPPQRSVRRRAGRSRSAAGVNDSRLTDNQLHRRPRHCCRPNSAAETSSSSFGETGA